MALEHFPAKWKPVSRQKMRQEKNGAYSDRKTGTHFCGIRAGSYGANRQDRFGGGDGLRRPFRVVSDSVIQGGRGDVPSVSALQEQ
jgi:hypothetical protein